MNYTKEATNRYESKLFFEMLKAEIANKQKIFKTNKQISAASFKNIRLSREFYNSLPKNLGIKTALIHGSTAKGTAGNSQSCLRNIYYLKTEFLAYEFYLDKTAKSDIDIIFIMSKIETKKINIIKSVLKKFIKDVQVTLNIIHIKEAINAISDSKNPQALRRVIT